MFGAAQELPVLLIPLSIGTLGSHWSLLRARRHYPSDIIAGGAIALAVSAAAWKLRPPQPRQHIVGPLGSVALGGAAQPFAMAAVDEACERRRIG